MGILTLRPMGLSLLCLFIALGIAQGYETVNIAQPPCTALPPASGPGTIEQPPDSIVFPPASAPTSIAEPPSISTELPPASAPTSISEPPSISTELPPASAPTSIAEPPSISTELPPASAPTSISESPSISTELPPASAPTSIAEPPSISTELPPASAPTSISESPSISTELPPASAPTSITEPPCGTVLPPASAPTSISEPPSISTELPPASAPVQQQPPKQTPTHHLPPRKLVAVQGVVYCKPCHNRGVETLLGAAPLEGAVVKLLCKNTRTPVVVQTTTDKNGQFFINGPKTVSTYGYHKCKVFLVSSPDNACNIPTNLHGGVHGAMLMRSTKPPGSVQTSANFDLFKVGSFAFDHTTGHPCPSLVH